MGNVVNVITCETTNDDYEKFINNLCGNDDIFDGTHIDNNIMTDKCFISNILNISCGKQTIANIIDDNSSFSNNIDNHNYEQFGGHSIKLTEAISKFMMNSFSYLSLEKINSKNQIISYVKNYENKYKKLRDNSINEVEKYFNKLNHNPELSFVEQNVKLLNELTHEICEIHKTREKLFLMKNNNIRKYNAIEDEFIKITHKHFDVVQIHGIVDDYEYVILNNDQRYKCSYGESELIDLLCKLCDDDVKQIIIDEPCAHLSSQNKSILADMFKNTQKQLIIVTHDIELITKDQNLIHFRTENFKTFKYSLNDMSDYKIKKEIYENKNILFAKNVLLVEGYFDYIFMDALFCKLNVMDYLLIIQGSCDNDTPWKLCKQLKISHKIISDFDVLYSQGLSKNLRDSNAHKNDRAIKFLERHDINNVNYIIEQCSTLNNIRDEIISRPDLNVFIWRSDWNDIEGVGKNALHDDNFNKDSWSEYTKQKIIDNIDLNDIEIQKLMKFLNINL
jgi:hypothetical protein